MDRGESLGTSGQAESVDSQAGSIRPSLSQPANPFDGAKLPASPTPELTNSSLPSPGTITHRKIPFSPEPNEQVMDFISGLNEHFLLRGPPLLRSIPGLNNHPALQGFMRISSIDFPKEDIARLQKYISKETVAFVAPNHPEVMSDWQIDKEVSRRAAPRLAFWAADDVVNMHPKMRKFWLGLNLIPNEAGEPGKKHSVDWALKGNGVLIHPEGGVHWTADVVGQLYPGIIDLALRAKKELCGVGDERPVYVIPLIYRYNFNKNVAKDLQHEMDYIERSLGLPDGRGFKLGDRFFHIQKNVLLLRFGVHGFQLGVPVTQDNFFEVQSAFREHVLSLMEDKYKLEVSPDWERVRKIRHAIKERRDAGATDTGVDKRLVDEAVRLEEFNEYVYGGAQLTQEQIAESLTRLRITYLTNNLLDKKHKFVPTPVASRVVHIRAVEPQILDWKEHTAFPYETKSYREALLSTLRDQLQAGVDSLRAETDHERTKFAIANPFASA